MDAMSDPYEYPCRATSGETVFITRHTGAEHMTQCERGTYHDCQRLDLTNSPETPINDAVQVLGLGGARE